MSRLFIAAIAASLFTPATDADSVELSGGGHLTGKVKRTAEWVVVAVDNDIQIAIPASRVGRVVTSDQLQEYRQRAAVAGNSAERHYQLAIWCVSGKNVSGNAQHYKRHHMQRAIALDPEHAKARAALGYAKPDGKWVLKSEIMKQRGMILRAGRQELPEAVAIEGSKDAANVISKQWIRDVKALVKSALTSRRPAKAQESFEALRAIKHPLAAAAIALQLKESRDDGSQGRELRRLWVNLLGRFRNAESLEALVLAGVEENDPGVREDALEQLTQYGASTAVATYLPMLKSNDNRIVNRAARALSWFPDPELDFTYVDALVTQHKHVGAPPPGMQLGIDNNQRGGGGLAMGGKAKVYIETKTNPAVLALLKAIEPNADHGYDEQAWRLHFARKRMTYSGDLRRDP